MTFKSGRKVNQQFTQYWCALYCLGFAWCVCLSLSVFVCLTDVSVPSCLSLVQVLQCDNSSASLLSCLLAWLSPLIQRVAAAGKLREFPLRESTLWNSFNKNIQCRL